MKGVTKQTAKYARLIKYALREWPVLVVIVFLTLLSSAVTVLQPWPLKILVDYALGDADLPTALGSLLSTLPLSETTSIILAAAVASVALFALITIIDTGMTWAWSSYGERLAYELAADLFYRLQRVSLVIHNRRTVGDSLSRLTGDVYCIYNLAQTFLVSPVQNLLILTTVGLVAWNLDPGLAALTLLMAPLQVASALYFGPMLKRRAEQNRKAESSLLTFVHQTLTSMPLVQAFATEKRNGLHFRRLAEEATASSQKSVLLANAYGVVSGFTAVLCNAFVLYVGAARVLSGEVSLGSVLVLLAYMGSMQGALSALLSIYTSLKPLEANIDRVFEILDLDPGVRESAEARTFPENRAGGSGHVRLENVTFGYEEGHPVLKGITVEARPGETIALVGPTGAGKTTLASLILRFFDPWTGRIVIDGMDVRDVKLASLRAQVALVLQEPFLLPLSIAENIAYGRPEARRHEVIEAAVAANADDFIRRLPAGYDTIIGERGATLSGGEKQRIAIARALLKNAPILILDEPTSALDAKTEALLLEALQRLMVGRTTFIIAHRLSTIRNADRIVVLESGRVAEEGSHQELLASQGQYYRFHSLQVSSLTTSGVAP